jgi:hypothetical protein
VITVVVTATDGTTTKTYTHTITKQAALVVVGSKTSSSTSTSAVAGQLAGDLIVVTAIRNTTTATPGNGSGFTSKLTRTGNGQGIRVSQRIATADAEAIPVFDNSNRLLIEVYRGASGIGAIDSAVDTANSVPVAPGLTPTGDDRSLSVIISSPKGTSGYGATDAAFPDYTTILLLNDQRLFRKNAPNDFDEVSAAGPTNNASPGWIAVHMEIRAP